jgi:hypothetical protein
MRVGEELSAMMEVLPQKKSQASAAINDASDFHCRAIALVSRRNDSRVFHHQDDGALRSTGPMFETPRHHEALPPPQSDGTIRQVDQELVFQDEKEFVILVVLMPMVFSLRHAQAHD